MSGADPGTYPMSTMTTTPTTMTADMNGPQPESWYILVRRALVSLGGQTSLQSVYAALAKSPKAQGRLNWHAKVRQTIQASDQFVRVGPGMWALSERFTADEIAAFERERRERFPRKKPVDT